MANILAPQQPRLDANHMNNMFGGNTLWADPEEARRVGAAMLHQLVERYRVEDERGKTPAMPYGAGQVFSDALKALDVAGLPTERRAHILHGFIGAAAEAGVLGGEPEWVSDQKPQGGEA